jgi:AraC-like DNA-binding protein
MEKIPVRRILATRKEPDSAESFRIRDVYTLLAGKDLVQELHRHDFFYILALHKGTGKHEIDFTSYTVCDHSVFFLRPGQVHRLVLQAGSTGYVMQFRTDFYYPHDKASIQLLNKASNTNFYQLDANRFQKLFSALTSVFQEYADRQERHQEAIKANLSIFFIELLREHAKNPSDGGSPYVQERLEAFLEILQTNILSHKQVSEYAAMLNLSTYQLNAITKRTLGKTCTEVIHEYMLLEAKRYLLATTDQITQIALQLGYEDVSYFIRFFKKHTGYSPEAFRGVIGNATKSVSP